MGFLTTFTIYNDGCDRLNPDNLTPEQKDEILRKLYYGCIGSLDDQRKGNKAVDIGFQGFCNLITVQYHRHADDHTVYVHYGNTVFNINSYNDDFKELAKRDPKIVETFLKVAKRILKDATDELKNYK